MMRLVMMGTGPFAVPTFFSLLDSGYNIAALFTRPAPVGRVRGTVPPNPMRDAAQARGIPIFEPESVNSDEAQRELRALCADLFVVCDYGQILKGETLGLAPLGGINLHGSLLPKYRGAAPIHWAIWNGDCETGVTVIHMTPKLDGGPILAIRKTPIGEDETTAELEPRLAQMGIAPVHESLEMLSQWDRISAIGSLQDATQVCSAPRLKKTDGAVRWTDSAERIRNQVRALKPWPGTYTHWRRTPGEPLRIILDWVSVSPLESGNAAPGEVVQSDGCSLHVATGKGVLSIDRVQPAGKRVLHIDEFLRGYTVRVGDRLEAMRDA